MSFSQKQISISLSLSNGQFSGGGNTATLEGLRMSVKISHVLPPSQGMLTAEIFGLSLDMMNQLTVLPALPNTVANNTISVSAGDTQAGMALVFTGYIFSSFCNAQAMPQVSLHIEATAAALPAVQVVQPTSVQGSGDVSQIMGNLAGQMGFQFEDNGVSAKVSNPYLYGSPYMQALELAEHAGIGWGIQNGTMAIWPAGGSRQSSTPLVSPQTGMEGYPAYCSSGLIVTTLFDPSLDIKMGGSIQVQSDLTPACGTWNVNSLDYALECQTPRGEWFAIATCSPSGGDNPT